MLNLNEINTATKGDLINGNENTLIKRYKIDSREVEKNDFFIPIVGEKVDSHKFILSIMKNKPVGFFVSEEYYNNNMDEIKGIIKEYNDICIIKVKDTLKALYEIGKYNRSKHMDIKLIGVTGSVGKTSTKEMISNVVETKYNVLKTYKNFNGYIGLSLMLLQLENQDVAILEHGIDYIGEMDQLAEASRPDISIITNIGMSHIEHFKTQENILKEKINICKYTKDKIFVNSDDKLLSGLKNDKITPYSFKEITNINNNIDSVEFNVNEINVKINEYGNHNLINSLVAIKVGLYLNIETDKILEGISKYKNFNRRFEVYKLKSGKTIIDDTYNASYDSFKSGIESLSYFSGNKILILGDILETGEFAEHIHRKVGKIFKEYNGKFIEVITYGENAKYINEESKKYLKSKHYENKDEIVEYLNKLDNTYTIYLKASNGMKFDEIIKKLT